MCVGAILPKVQLEGFCLICRGNQQCFNVELCRGTKFAVYSLE